MIYLYMNSGEGAPPFFDPRALGGGGPISENS